MCENRLEAQRLDGARQAGFGVQAPEHRLSDLIAHELGTRIDPAALRILIRAHWPEVAGLAHEIHGRGLSGRGEASFVNQRLGT